MKIGVAVEGIRRAAEAGDLAERVEGLGFDSIWTPDHLSFSQPILDPFTVLGIYAARTKRVLLGTGVFLLPLRHPALVAKQAASLDWLSGGRFVLGIGVGGEFPREFAAAGVPLGERGARANEAIPILRALWAGQAPPEGRAILQGAADADRARARAQRQPADLGGRTLRSGAATRRSSRRRLHRLSGGRRGVPQAHVADPGDACDGTRTGCTVHGGARRLRADRESRAAAVERTAARLGAMYGAATAPAAARFAIAGTADDCREQVAALAAAGVEHLVLSPIAPLEEYDEQLAGLAEALIHP